MLGVWPWQCLDEFVFTGRLCAVLGESLTPSLRQYVKFPGSKMHARHFKQYTCRSYSTSTFSALCFDENPFTYRCEKGGKKLKGFKFGTFIGCFQVASWQ